MLGTNCRAGPPSSSLAVSVVRHPIPIGGERRPENEYFKVILPDVLCEGGQNFHKDMGCSKLLEKPSMTRHLDLLDTNFSAVSSNAILPYVGRRILNRNRSASRGQVRQLV